MHEINHGQRWPVYSPAAIAMVSDIAATNQHVEFTKNSQVDALEAAGRRLFRRRFAIAMNSGTSALTAAYFALNLKFGSQVLAPAYTFYATVTAMLPWGLEPQLLDIDETTLNLSERAVLQNQRAGGHAIVVTHNWGNQIPHSELTAIRDGLGVPMIEDCSHLCGTLEGGEQFSHRNPADISIVSLGARKIVTGGAGGLLLTDDVDIYERAVALSQPKRRNLFENQKMLERFAHVTLGMNFRVSPICAALALDHLKNLSAVRSTWSEVGSEVIARLSASLPSYRLPKHDKGVCWYKIPVISDSEPVDAQRISKAMDGLSVTVDSAVRPFFTLGGYPYPSELKHFPNYQRTLSRLATIDISGEVGKRYAQTIALA